MTGTLRWIVAALTVACVSASLTGHPMSIAPGEAFIRDGTLVLRIDLAHQLHHMDSAKDGAQDLRAAVAQSVHVISASGDVVALVERSSTRESAWIELHAPWPAPERAVALRYAPVREGLPTPQQLQLVLAGGSGDSVHLSAGGNTEIIESVQDSAGHARAQRVAGFDAVSITVLRDAAGGARGLRVESPRHLLRTWSALGAIPVNSADGAQAFLDQWEDWIGGTVRFEDEHGAAINRDVSATTFIDVSGASITPDVAGALDPAFQRVRCDLFVVGREPLAAFRWSGFNSAVLRARVLERAPDGPIETATLNPSQPMYSLHPTAVKRR